MSQKNKKKKQLAKTSNAKTRVFVTTANSDTEYDSDEYDNEQLTQSMSNLNKQLKKQQQHFNKLHESFTFISSQFDTIQKRIDGLVKMNKMMKEDIKQLKQSEANLTKRVTRLESTTTQRNQDSNENHMIVTNLPKFSADTNLKQVVMKIGELVEQPVKESEILNVYQNENKKFNTHPLIVKMSTNALKKKCMEFRKSQRTIELNLIAPNLQNNDKNINFHHLMEKEYADLLKKAKDAAKAAKFKFVWFSNNNVLTRKDENAPIIRINSEKDLQKIKS